MSTPLSVLAADNKLTLEETRKRKDQRLTRPRVYKKIQNFFSGMADGAISPILRLKTNKSLCNLQCEHCCEEPYMERDLIARTGSPDPRPQMTIAEYADLSRQADEYGIFRFVLTGGEAILDRQIEPLIEALDPTKHLVILDTNGWHFTDAKAQWFVGVGGYKVQISLDSFFESEHDAFRNRKGSYKRAIRAIWAAKKAGLELLISTCIVKDRVFSDEFSYLLEFCEEHEIPLYVTLAKPVGSAREHEEWICSKGDMDALRLLEKKYDVFTHMSPSYGMPGRCITVKGINTINHDGEVVPCPYMDLSIGNLRQLPLRDILERGMRNKWLGPYRDECIIGEHPDFIKFHNQTVAEHLKSTPLLPVPYESGFAQAGEI